MKSKLCILILLLSALVAAQPNIGPSVRRPCTSTVTTSCTPQVSSAGAYVPYVVGGSGANPLGLFVVAGAANAPANAVNLALLSSGLLKMTVAGGVATLTTAGAGSDYVAPGGNVATATDLAGYPSLCTGTQFSQGLSHGSNNCGTPAGGGGSGDTTAHYLISTADATLTNAVNLGLLSTGLVKITVSGAAATVSNASAGSDFQAVITGAPGTWPSFGGAALLSVGTTTGTVAAGDDSRFANAGTVTVVSSGALTSTALVTGGGTTTLQTPAATATMDASGNVSTPGSVTAASFATSSTTFKASGTEGAKPTAPAASQENMWFDSTDHVLHGQGSGGTETWTAAVPLAAPGSDHKWVFYVDTTGTQQRTQPAMGDISGTLGLAAGGTNVDLSTAGGTVNTTGAQVLHENASHVVSSSAIAAADIPSALRARSIACGFNGGGTALTAGATMTCYWTVPFACTITGFDVSTNVGTASWDVWKVATGTTAPTSANTILTGGYLVNSGTTIHSASTSLFTTTAVAANDVIGLNLQAVASSPIVATVGIQCAQ